LGEPLPEFARGRRVTGAERTFLVQFRKDLAPAERRDLEASGVWFVDYVPSHAYLVRASREAFRALKGHPLVRWIDAFRAGYTVPAGLRSDAWTQDVHLNIRLLPGENPLELLTRLQQIDSAIRLSAVQGEVARGAVLRVLVPSGHLHPFVESAAED